MIDRRPLALLGLALVALAISAYLASFQLGLVARPWDPFFGDGSRRVLTSPVSRLLPVPDALVGAAAYLVDAVLALLVAIKAPRADLLSGALAAIASIGALVGVVLALLQPIVAGAFCTLCLCSSGISVVLAAGAIGEARDRLGPAWQSHERTDEATQ